MNYNQPFVKVHRLFGLIWLLSLILAAGAYANGSYQWTEDRKKALVWNNDPKPGDGASWSGKHDAEGYATGPGTLTWYRVDRGYTTGSNIALARKKTPISSYSGTMAHGKFNGAVTTVDHGKTYHANFADGQRKGRWSSGPAVVKAEKAEAAEPERSASPTTETAATTQKAPEENAASNSAEEATADIPAAGPAEEPEVTSHKSEVSGQPPSPAGYGEPRKSESQEKTEPTQKTSPPLIAQASTEQPDEASTPRQPVTKKAALAPGAVRAIERPTGAPAKKSAPASAKPEKTSKPKPAPSQPIEVETDLTEQPPAEGPPAETQTEKLEPPALKSERSAPKTTAPSAKQTPVDDSIRSLVGPPSSLRSSPPKSETNAPAQIPSPAAAAASPPASAGPKLTAIEAMDIADIEARTRGYDLGEYQLPKAEYNATNDTWSVSYVGQPDKSKKLSVTVEDKSGKAEVKK